MAVHRHKVRISRKKGPNPAKAAKILHDGKFHGKRLTTKQRKFMVARSRA